LLKFTVWIEAQWPMQLTKYGVCVGQAVAELNHSVSSNVATCP